MATVPSNPKLRDVQSVFGGTSTLRGYRRGVGIPDISAYSVVSTTTPMLRQFANLVYPAVTMQTIYGYSQTMFDIFTGDTVGCATYVDIRSNGQCQVFTQNGAEGTTMEQNFAFVLAGSPSNYDVYLHRTGGIIDTGGSFSGTANTWLNCGTDRSWGVSQESSSQFLRQSSASGTIAIRPAGGGANLVSVSFTMIAHIESNA